MPPLDRTTSAKYEVADIKRKLIAVALAAMIGLSAAVATPKKVEAHSNGWWIPGAIIGGLALGAITSRPYYYGPGYYGYGYDPYYYGSGPYYYGGGPYYYGRPYRHYRRYYRHW
jgi:hypothetical protein